CRVATAARQARLAVAGEVEPPDRPGPGLDDLGRKRRRALAEAAEQKQGAPAAVAQTVQGELDSRVAEQPLQARNSRTSSATSRGRSMWMKCPVSGKETMRASGGRYGRSVSGVVSQPIGSFTVASRPRSGTERPGSRPS